MVTGQEFKSDVGSEVETEARPRTHSKTFKASHMYSTFLAPIRHRKKKAPNVHRASLQVVIDCDPTAPVDGAASLVGALGRPLHRF